LLILLSNNLILYPNLLIISWYLLAGSEAISLVASDTCINKVVACWSALSTFTLFSQYSKSFRLMMCRGPCTLSSSLPLTKSPQPNHSSRSCLHLEHFADNKTCFLHNPVLLYRIYVLVFNFRLQCTIKAKPSPPYYEINFI